MGPPPTSGRDWPSYLLWRIAVTSVIRVESLSGQSVRKSNKIAWGKISFFLPSLLQYSVPSDSFSVHRGRRPEYKVENTGFSCPWTTALASPFLKVRLLGLEGWFRG